MTPNIIEITQALGQILESDSSLQVQRSAVLVLKMIVEGLKDGNFIQILGKSTLPLYKLLVKTRRQTMDDIIQLHTDLTLEYLGDLVKKSMFPEMVMKKEIII